MVRSREYNIKTHWISESTSSSCSHLLSGTRCVTTYADTLYDCLLSLSKLHYTYPRHICLLITPPDSVPVPVYLHALTVQDGTFSQLFFLSTTSNDIYYSFCLTSYCHLFFT